MSSIAVLYHEQVFHMSTSHAVDFRAFFQKPHEGRVSVRFHLQSREKRVASYNFMFITAYCYMATSLGLMMHHFLIILGLLKISFATFSCSEV